MSVSNISDLITSLNTESGANKVEHGLGGFHYIENGDSTLTHVYHTIAFNSQTEVSTITSHLSGDSNLTNVTFPAGFILYGCFSDIQITSGSAICYILGQTSE